MLLASAVPVMGGRTVVTYEPLAGATTTGAAGGVVSMVKVLAALLALWMASTSVAALTVCGPAARGTGNGKM